MKFNLSNEKFYCEYWRKLFEEFLTNYGLEKTSLKNNVEIGHYNFATKIGYGFPNGYAEKRFIHTIYKNESFYPKSMLITKKWMMNNINLVLTFIGKERKILKNNFGVGAKSIYLVKSVEDCFNHMNNRDFYILQNEIEPLLHNGKKLDERVYYLVIKEDNRYSGFLFQEGHIKLAGFNFDKNNNNMGVFATNIKAPKPDKSNPDDFTIDTEKFLENNPNKKTWITNRLNIMLKISNKFLPVIAENVKKYYETTFEPQYMYQLYGIDLLIDKNYNFFLCEFNGKPGVVYEKVMPKNITDINKIMCRKIQNHFLLNWINDKQSTYYKDSSIKKLSEFIS